MPGEEHLQDELQELLGRPVDLIPQASVTNPFRRKHIWETRQQIYAA